MKAYKVEMIIVDFNGYGLEELKLNLESMRFYNPDIIDILEGDIGEWDDDHPLNYKGTTKEEKLKYFKL
jgi:hypothetical protein